MFEVSMNSELVATRKKNKNNKCSLKINLIQWETGLKDRDKSQALINVAMELLVSYTRGNC
jgi:hypothetical protein